jgi:uncharacterized membrane protein YvbJ
MASCVGCGAQLAPAWRYCIHCGIAVTVRFAPINPRTGTVSHARPSASPWRTLIIGGVIVFLVAIALIALAIAFASGTFG